MRNYFALRGRRFYSLILLWLPMMMFLVVSAGVAMADDSDVVAIATIVSSSDNGHNVTTSTTKSTERRRGTTSVRKRKAAAVIKASITAPKVAVFNGVPEKYGWGDDVVYVATTSKNGIRSMGSTWLGGLPFVCIWAPGKGGYALFNVASQHEDFNVEVFTYIEEEEGSITEIKAWGSSNIVKYRIKNGHDYHNALRYYATRMKKRHDIAIQPAPEWSYDPIWETYGFEESWNPQKVMNMLPLLKSLGIRTITLDSGWFGTGAGGNWDSKTGDFEINPSVIGTEEDFKNFIQDLHDEGFKVRLWWVAGVAEKGTRLHKQHPDWFLTRALPAWGDKTDTGDWYLNPTLSAVRRWNRDVVNRFIDYGADGFKVDDVYEIGMDGAAYHRAYAKLMKDIYTTSIRRNPGFVVNVCNCGIAQNFYQFPAANQLITSDPVGPEQFRHRAKYLHGLNVRGAAAILGDHIELTKGDVGKDQLKEASFYKKISDCDFASVVALGMVLETKFSRDPGARYAKWFRIYNEYKFYKMEWVNLPLYPWMKYERYLLRDVDNDGSLYFSYFLKRQSQVYSGPITFSRLVVGEKYTIYDIKNSKVLGSFVANAATKKFSVTNQRGCMVVRVKATA